MMINTTIDVLFEAIAELESANYTNDEFYYQDVSLKIQGPNNLVPIKALIKKTAPSISITFNDGSTLTCANKHILLKDQKKIFADLLKINDEVDCITGAKKISGIQDIGEIDLFDFWIDTEEHLYATANGILHHNTSMCAALSLVLYLNGLQTLIIVPSSDLVTQTVNEFREKLEFYPITVGEYSGSNKDIDHPIVVATWQSLQNVPHYMSYFNAVVVDESHGAKAAVIKDLLDNHGKHISHRYGVTGTFPKSEADQMNLKCSIGRIVCEVSARWLIDQGYLSEVEIEPIETADTADLPDYSSEKSFLSGCAERLDVIAQLIQDKRDQYGNTMVLVHSIAQGRQLQKLIPGSIFLSGESAKDLRQENYSTFADHDGLIVIASSGIASTGLSIDRIFCLFLVDAGKSFVKAIQSVGRGLRKKGDKNRVQVVDLYSKLKFSKKHFKERQKHYKEAGYPVIAAKKLKYQIHE